MALHYFQTRVNPLGKDEGSPALTITPSLRKGQKNNPLKNMDIPMEIREPLRRGNSRQLAHAMRTAGGPMSANGRPYAAVLEERGVNPNIAATNVNLAKQLPNDIYKTASLKKIAFNDIGATAGGATIGYGIGHLVNKFNPALGSKFMAAAPLVGGIVGYGANRMLTPRTAEQQKVDSAPIADKAGSIAGGIAAGSAVGGIGNAFINPNPAIKGSPGFVSRGVTGALVGGLVGGALGYMSAGSSIKPQPNMAQPQVDNTQQHQGANNGY